jgi:Mrp family chromosome partitioning ATPase
VLFDSPPLLATSEAVVLASLMGQIVMVVEAGKTTHGRVKEAIARIHEDKPIGMVLNKNKTTGGSGYYYGYYGYR